MNTLVTTLIAPSRSTADPRAEAIRAARKINEEKGDRKIILFLDETYESFATFEAFVNAKVTFSVSRIQIKDALQSSEAIQSVCREHNVPYDEIYFDFCSPAHITALDFLAEKMNCNYLDALIQMWAIAQREELCIFPGWFTFPTGLYSTLDDFGYNLPNYYEKKLYDFFNEHESIPSFLSSTAELANSFLMTEFSRESVWVYNKLNDSLKLTEAGKAVLFEDSGFKLLPKQFKPNRLNIAKSVRKLKSIDVRKYETKKYFKLLSDSPIQYHRQKINIDITEANGIRAATKNLILSHQGGGLLIEADESMQNKKYDQNDYVVFPELISTFQYDQPLEDIIRFINRQTFYVNASNSLTEGDLHTKSEFQPVIDFINRCVRMYLDRIGYFMPDFEITQCWATKTFQGQSHHPHSHPNCFISGVFYLSDAGGGDIVFHTRTPSKRIEPEIDEFTAFNQNTFEVKPKVGRLVLFNSEIRHSTKQNLMKEPRLSVAFNVWPRGELGSYLGFAWTKS